MSPIDPATDSERQDTIDFKSDEFLNLNLLEHKLILNSLQDEISKPFSVKPQYYADEELKMITGYISKTRLFGRVDRSLEDFVFESLIKGVGRLKC